MIVELVRSFNPDAECLLREISRHVDDDMLTEIAAADYGRDREEHLLALRPVRDQRTFPDVMYWYPMEVLELTRWCEPDDPTRNPGRTGEFGHWIRAFSSAAILRATGEPWNYRVGLSTVSTLIHLIQSLSALPVDLNRQAASFMSWLLANPDPEGQDEQGCYYCLGVLWFALHMPEPPPDRTLVFLAQWIVQREEELRRDERHRFDRWLLGLGAGNPPPSDWEQLGAELCKLDLTSHTTELREWVQLIGGLLSGE